jgi:hypothetical protein
MFDPAHLVFIDETACVSGGMTAPGVIDGAMNGSMFVGYVEQILVPAMKVIVFRCPPGA